MENINEVLLRQYEEWEKYIKQELKQEFNIENLCLPFVVGVNETYIQSQKKVVFVGKETFNFKKYKFDCKEYDLKSNQEWTIRYSDRQIGIKNEESYNPSPFWQVYRLLSENGYGVCWNNINKIQNLSYEGAKISNGKYGVENKSLMERQIIATKCQAIVLSCGKTYIDSIATIFNVENDKIPKLSKDNKVIDITNELNIGIPVIYSYHPRYLYKKDKENLINILNEHFK